MSPLAAVLFSSLVSLAAGFRVSQSSMSCNLLADRYPNDVFFPSSPQYINQSRSVWSETCLTTPWCVFEPKKTTVLASALSILVQNETPFAVRSGGHMPVPFANGINEGILISMSGLNKTILTDDNKIARIQPGQRWQDVYGVTSPYGLAVAGGRFSSVGVGGLIVGGGLSFFASSVGWTANTVINYELVLANGTILNVNSSSHPGLWWALKGGSSNFGIVTRYDLKTVRVSQVFGGFRTYSIESFQKFFDAVVNYTAPGGGSENSDTAIIPNIIVSPNTGGVIASNMFFYNGNSAPPAFEKLLAIPSLTSTVSVRNSFINFTDETANQFYGARDSRWLYTSVAVGLTPTLMAILNSTFTSYALQDLANIEGAGASINMQPITKTQLQAARKAGGDALDLDPDRGSFIVVLISLQWQRPEDDDKLRQFAQDWEERVRESARGQGIENSFIYLNDAGPSQKVFEAYGYGRSLPKLVAISQAYDPDQVFQRLLSGGFKLSS